MFEIPFRMESSLFKPNWWSLILFIIIFDVIKRPTKNFPSSIFSHRKCSNETHWKPISNATIKTNHQITWVQIINLIDSSRAIHYNPIYIWCQYEVESKIVNEIEKKKKNSKLSINFYARYLSQFTIATAATTTTHPIMLRIVWWKIWKTSYNN